MGMKASEIEKFIRDAFPDAEIEMKDLAGDDNHWSATVKSAAQQNYWGILCWIFKGYLWALCSWGICPLVPGAG